MQVALVNRSRAFARGLVVLATWGVAACGGASVAPGPDAAITPVACAEPALPDRRIVRLADHTYRNIVAELLGPAVEPARAALQAVQASGGNDRTYADDVAPLSDDLAAQYQRAAEAAGAAVGPRWADLLPCPEAPATATPCVRTWLGGFVARAFRRPLEADELDDFALLYDQGGSAADGVRLVVTAVLQAPSFLYHRELGEPAGDHSTLSNHELAAQLGLWLRDGLPDEPLWQAAQAHTLSDPAVLRAHVARLGARAESRDVLTDGILRWFELPALAHARKDPGLFPSFDTDRESLLASAQLFVGDVLGGDLRRLFDSPTVPVDARMAATFGWAAPTDGSFTRVDAPDRAGLLTHPAFLARFAGDATTNLVERGAFVRRSLLCGELLPPPPNLNVSAPGKDLDQRQFAAYRASQAACAGCHTLMDPFGLLLEPYDAVGRHRPGVDAAVMVTDTDFDGPVSDAVELGRKLARSPTANACLASHMLALALGRAPACAPASLLNAWHGHGGRLEPLMRAIADLDAFRLRAP